MRYRDGEIGMHGSKCPEWFLLLGMLGAAALGAPAAGQAPAAASPAAPGTAAAAPSDPKASSYSLGVMFGSQLRNGGVGDKVVLDEIEKGLRDGLAGAAPSDGDKARMNQMLKAGRAALVESNRARAKEFLDENKGAPGVVTTPSGLQYIVLKEGDTGAPSPQASDRVVVDYRGRLLDGSMFDSSMSHGGSATLNLSGGALKGFKEALVMMKPGAQWRLFMPPELGYDASPPPGIPPGALLVYDLTLVRVEAPRTLAPHPPAEGGGSDRK